MSSAAPFAECLWLHPRDFPFARAEAWPEDARENLHFAFRGNFELPGAGAATSKKERVRLLIAADDLFKVWIDGALVGAGPAPCGPAPCFYNVFETTLRAAERHSLAVQVHYHGPRRRAHVSGDGFLGLVARLEVRTPEGWRGVCRSDATWSCRRLLGRSAGGRMYGYTTQFAEDIDLRVDPPDWQMPDFDDSGWARAAAIEPPAAYRFVEQISSPVVYFAVEPTRIVKKGPGRFLLDFGEEIVGETQIEVTGPAGHRVEVWHAEELAGPDEARHAMRCGCDYREWITLSGRAPDRVGFFDYKGFRYVEVLDWPEPEITGRVRVLRRESPWPEDATRFECADAGLEAIWRLCAQAIRVGTQERYLDCPTREKIAFLGDALVTGHAHLLLTADARVYRQLWEDLKVNHDECPLVGAHGGLPGSEILVEYSLLIPEMLLTYHRLTGDAAPLHEWAPRVGTMLEAYGRYAGEDGLLVDLHRAQPGLRPASPLVDWPGNLRDGYDDPSLLGCKPDASVRGVVNTVVNLRHAAAWRDHARVLRITGAPHAEAEARGERLRAAARRRLHGADGLFVDRVGSAHASFHANVTALDCGVLDAGETGPVLGLIRAKGLVCGVWFAHFVLRALAAHGEAALALDLLNNRGERGWLRMLASGATACLEAWAPEQKWNTSWCHPWASAPIPFIVEQMMGVVWDEPGRPRVDTSHRPPAAWPAARLDLKWAGGRVASSQPGSRQA